MENIGKNNILKDNYIKPKLEIVTFDYKDVISASAGPCTGDTLCGIDCMPDLGCTENICPPDSQLWTW